MRGDQFFNMGYGSMDDDEDEEEMVDLSGFMGGAPSLERPKVTPRARSRASNMGSGPESTAGPSPIPNPQPIGSTDNVGYSYNLPVAPEGGVLAALHPFQADDNSLLGPKFNTIMKGAGATGLVLGGVYALGKRGSGGLGVPASTMLGLSAIAYTFPVVGWNYGVFGGIGSKLGRYSAATLVHAVQLGYLKKITYDRFRDRGLGQYGN